MSCPLFVMDLAHGEMGQTPIHQGPDPSLVYRPDVDPELTKSKDSFRNYTVSGPLPRPPHLLCGGISQPCLFPQL